MFEIMLAFFNDLGTFAFALSGARLVDGKNRRSLTFAFLPAFLTAFGGGLTRDIVVLKRTPAILSSQDAVVIMVITYLLYVIIRKMGWDKYLIARKVEVFLVVCDAIGVAAFIQCGSDAAFNCKANYEICVLTGVMTAIGGGMLASASVGSPVVRILGSSLSYRTIVILHAVAYVSLHNLCAREPLIVLLVISCTFFCVIRDFLIKNNATESYYRIRTVYANPGKNIFVVSRGALFNMVKNLIGFGLKKWVSYTYRGIPAKQFPLLLK